jgi:hypothetical protein
MHGVILSKPFALFLLVRLFVFVFKKYFLKSLYFIYIFFKLIFFIFLDYFNVLILKIIFKK